MHIHEHRKRRAPTPPRELGAHRRRGMCKRLLQQLVPIWWKGRVPFTFINLSLSLGLTMPEWKGRVPLTRSHCERITCPSIWPDNFFLVPAINSKLTDTKYAPKQTRVVAAGGRRQVAPPRRIGALARRTEAEGVPSRAARVTAVQRQERIQFGHAVKIRVLRLSRRRFVGYQSNGANRKRRRRRGVLVCAGSLGFIEICARAYIDVLSQAQVERWTFVKFLISYELIDQFARGPSGAKTEFLNRGRRKSIV
ncbi:hypothetical protein EVAR_42463_1 [Eumeta japonica]|uniref:Uncharacterized protein n=1 Tax=Eumeta variegata TaxID=151549 RepID=A0A4C1XX27_EUMVA|nr:hypothetical protein EVAR_42463_1 [Eumeta japonica]